MNNAAKYFGIRFTGSCGKHTEFLDTTISVSNNQLTTDMYIKPTDSMQYIHRRSFHPEHMFRSLPYSQYRRAVILCSDPVQRVQHIKRMTEKILKSGYHFHELYLAELRALSLSREELLKSINQDGNKIKPEEQESYGNGPKTTTFVLPYCDKNRDFRTVLSKFKQEIKECTDYDRVTIAEKSIVAQHHSSFVNQHFPKRPLAIPVIKNAVYRPRCKSCKVLNLEKSLCINGFNFKLDFALDCGSESVIYIAICRHCSLNFYFGQTVDTFRNRLNGHRDNFL